MTKPLRSKYIILSMDLAQIKLIHSTNKSFKTDDAPVLEWTTCLRSIYFFSQDILTDKKDAQVFEGKEAYQFLLQVICGLKSPMIGETEVFGQYKNFIESISDSNDEVKEIKKILVDIRNAAKKIRSQFLVNLGAQSYGSLLRKNINFNEQIHIIGSGQFVEEIVPWLSKKSKDIVIHCRSTKKAKLKFPNLKVSDLKLSTITTGTLIVAAPLSSFEVDKLIMGHPSMVFDLRGESKEDPLKLDAPIVSLKEFFGQIENNKTQITEKVKRANQEIDFFVTEKVKSQKLNPFGWDDICA